MEKLNFLKSKEKEKILKIVEKILNEFHINPKAIVLGGSTSRAETTKIDNLFLSDIEIIIYTYRKLWIQKNLNKIASSFKGDIDLTASFPIFLRTRKTMLNYDLKSSGIVLFGNDDFIKKRVKYSDKDIPVWEGIREIFFRYLLIQKDKDSEAEDYYNCCKAYIAIANAVLLLKKKYSDYYSRKLDYFKNKDIGIISGETADKIFLSLRFKLNKISLEEYSSKVDKKKVKKDIVDSLKNILNTYFKNEKSLEENLLLLDKRFPKNLIFNLYYFLSFFTGSFKIIHNKNIGNIRPKIINLIYNFKPTKFFYAVFMNKDSSKEKIKIFLSDFFHNPKLCFDSIYDIAWTYPYLEIKKDSEILDR